MNTKTILIATDLTSTSHSLNTLLKDSGHQVIEASSADSALTKMAALGTEQINFIIFDASFEFITDLKDKPVFKNTPAIMLHSGESAELRRQANIAGVMKCFVKPVIDDDLLKFVQRHTKQQRMPFNRWTATWPRTWPYALFKKHHTELNDLYWSNATAVHHVRMCSKSAKDTDDLSKALIIPKANAQRVNFTIGNWRSKIKEGENWGRLSALMGLSGYFETYLHSVTTLALKSDPGLLISSSRSVDGISLVKRKKLPDISPQVAAITKGTWPNRLNKYEAIFGEAPEDLKKCCADLEEMRLLRNSVGHAFGRDLDEYRNPLILKPHKLQRLSETRLQKWLGTVEMAASAIESHLRENHIGAIEALLHYHAWDKKYSVVNMREEQAFRLKFPDDQGSPPAAAYFRELINYYSEA